VRILVAEPIAAEGVERLRERHDVDEAVGKTPDELIERLPDYDALVVRSQVKVDAAMIEAGRRLAVIGRAGVGVDNVDLDAATRAGIVVVNAPTGNTIAAAEHTLGLLYALARRIPAADASVRRGEWKRSAFTGVELRGRTLGIVGMGKIGQAIAARARAMEMRVLASDPYLSTEQAAFHGAELVDLPTLLAGSDAVTVHVPLSRATRGMIGSAEIARMKRGAFLLNVARGGVIDEDAAAQALRDGQLGGAAFDVYTAEPPPADLPLRDAPNTVLTPHLGASTEEAQVAVAEEVADQILDVLDGRSARYAVNAPLLSPESARALEPYVPLAELLGRFLAQFARRGPTSLTVEVAGEPAAFDSAPIVAAALRGLLESTTTERVNLVNAAFIAKSRGLTVVERRSPDAGPFAALVSLAATNDGGTTRVAGTVEHGEPRIVGLDDYRVEMAPTDVMLITRHEDRPGTMGSIGRILGDADVNISAMHLARSAPRADALMILALDEDPPPAVCQAIRDQAAVLDLWTIRLGRDR